MFIECFDGIMGNSVDPFVRKLEKCSEMIGRLEVLVDKELDKPVDSEHPKYVAGDMLNDIREIVDNTRLQLEYVGQIERAYAAAFDFNDDCTDEAYDARRHFVSGFISGIQSRNI